MDQHRRASADPGRRPAAARRAERHHAGVADTRQPRIDYDDDTISGAIGQVATRDWGIRSSVGVPVSAEGQVWGAIVVALTGGEFLRPTPSRG